MRLLYREMGIIMIIIILILHTDMLWDGACPARCAIYAYDQSRITICTAHEDSKEGCIDKHTVVRQRHVFLGARRGPQRRGFVVSVQRGKSKCAHAPPPLFQLIAREGFNTEVSTEGPTVIHGGSLFQHDPRAPGVTTDRGRWYRPNGAGIQHTARIVCSVCAVSIQ